jgi:prepilin-type N-terminal cleavage/methylation domain-containing protein
MKTISAKAKIRGLTLVEVLVVLAVLFVLATMLLPNLAGSHKSPLIGQVSSDVGQGSDI